MPDIPAETVGERLRRVRVERGLSQSEVAAGGVTAGYISRIEGGARVPSIKALRKLAPKLGVSVEYLETGKDHPEFELWALRLDDYDLALRLGEPPSDFKEQLDAILASSLNAGHGRAAARARLALGAYASHIGDHAGAVTLLEAAIEQPSISPLSDPDAYITLAHSLAATGRERQAVTLLRSCLDELEARRPTPANTIARFATFLSYALTETGDLDGARSAIALALHHGRNSRDPYTRVRLYWSNARVASADGDYDLARCSINNAIALLTETEDTTHLARAHLLAAEIALAGGDYDTAAKHLAEAAAILPDGASLEDRAFLIVQQAFHAARTGNSSAAMDYATSAIATLGDHEDPAIRGAAHWALAEAYTAADAHHAAREAFAQASQLIPPGHKDAPRLLQAWERATTLANKN